MIRKFCLAMLMCGAFFVGCDRTTYTITLRPQKNVIKREIRTSTSFTNEEAQRLSRQYPASQPAGDSKVFVGTFSGRLPKDIGQAGWYLYYDTQMGESYVYSERFGKHDDMVAQLTAQFRAVDKLVDLLIGWFKMELGNDPNFEELRQFLDVNFRQDLKNMLMYVVVAMIEDNFKKDNDKAREENGKEIYLRVFQYLAERNYFDVKDLPKLLNINFGSNDGPLPIAQYIVTRKLGYDPSKELPQSLAFLKDEKSAEESLKKYLVTTPEYQKLLKEWESEKKSDPKAHKPDPFDVIEQLESETIKLDLDIFNSISHLDIDLTCATKPFATNGTWNEKIKTVTWSESLKEETMGLPMYVFALWAVPNDVFQKAHFGQVVLENAELSNYCLWRKSLSGRQGKQWDAFLENLKPGPDILDKIENFRMTDEASTQPNATTQPSGLAGVWIEKITEKLSKKDKSAAPVTQPTR